MKRNNKCVRAPWLSTHWDIYVKLNERGSIYLGFNLAEILKMSQNLKKNPKSQEGTKPPLKSPWVVSQHLQLGTRNP